jgi:ubiquinone/menaquinone biosynthesis C-methylase UbiE
MQPIALNAVAVLGFALVAVALFFFIVTRGALMLRALTGGGTDTSAHVYPLYSNMRLIKLVDHQPVISAILLFQYHKLVSRIVAGFEQMDLTGRKVLITSCAFGDVIPRVVSAALAAGAERVLISDIIDNELVNARSKLERFVDKIEFIEEDATDMRLCDGAVDVNVVFFLLHELPHHLKEPALREASRLLAPGGKLFLAEFHRPDTRLLRMLSWTYFKVFEPYGLALWNTHDPVECLQGMGGWSCERSTCLGGNFQVITATRS